MKIINNDFYTNNWQDFVHSWVMRRVEHLVQRYDLPLDVDTIESFRIDTTEYGTHDFVFTYTKDGVEHTLTITPKNDDVEISISDNSTWVVNGEDTGKNTAGQMGPTGKRGLKGVAGDKGPIGKKGITGLQGPQGNIGVTGDKGEKGLIGKKGETGLQGEQGLQGPQGDRGKTGVHGEQGKQGLQGMKGETGDQGPRGVAGTVTGEKGPIGPTGAKGETGDKGPTGSQGPQGIIGETGNKGPIGETGDPGPMGEQGPIGPQGPVGDKGPQGDTINADVTLNDNGNFFVNGEDTGKTWKGLPGDISGLTYDNYVRNIMSFNDNYLFWGFFDKSTILKNPNYSTYGVYGASSSVIKSTQSDVDNKAGYFMPTRSDLDLYDNSFRESDIKMFKNNFNTFYGPRDEDRICGIQSVPFGVCCTHLLLNNVKRFDSKESWTAFYGTFCRDYDHMADDNVLHFLIIGLLSGIVKVTDRNDNVRTFQPVGRALYKGEQAGSYYNTIVLRPYTKGPQSRWDSTLTSSGNYDVKIDVIDNDGNSVDFENGGRFGTHYGLGNLWSEHHQEME